MKKIRVAINGFGRIGRLTLRSFFTNGKKFFSYHDSSGKSRMAYSLMDWIWIGLIQIY